MQTKSKIKSKKTSQIVAKMNEGQSQMQFQPNFNEFIEVGAICGDGTFTQYTGRGAGSHHNGIKHKLYARRIELNPHDKSLASRTSISSSTITLKSEQITSTKQINNPSSISSSSMQKKKAKKISLKETFKTRTKKAALFEKVHLIFQTLYKDELQFVQEQLDDDLWLIISSICNLYDDLQQSSNLIKALQSSQLQQIKQSPSKQQTNYQLQDSLKNLQQQIATLQKQNNSLTKQLQKLTKTNTQLSQSLKQYKSRQKNYKKMLKLIQKQNPKIINITLEQSKININDLKKDKPTQNKVTTRSMLKKQLSKNEQKKIESLFSSDSSDFYDEDHTIVNLIKSMK